jgi:hypothetical protein
MSDYSPKYLPGSTITAVTSGVVTGGQQLVVSGTGTVAAASGTSAAWVGTALCDAASGAYVTLAGRGPVHVSTASGGVTAGQQVECAASGLVAAGATNPIGVALTTALTGASVEWMQV